MDHTLLEFPETPLPISNKGYEKYDERTNNILLIDDPVKFTNYVKNLRIQNLSKNKFLSGCLDAIWGVDITKPSVLINIEILLKLGYQISDESIMYSMISCGAVFDPESDELYDLAGMAIIKLLMKYGLNLVHLLHASHSFQNSKGQLWKWIVNTYCDGKIPYDEENSRGVPYFCYLIRDQMLEQLKEIPDDYIHRYLFRPNFGDSCNYFEEAASSNPTEGSCCDFHESYMKPDKVLLVLNFLKGKGENTMNNMDSNELRYELNNAFFSYIRDCYKTKPEVIEWFRQQGVPVDKMMSFNKELLYDDL